MPPAVGVGVVAWLALNEHVLMLQRTGGTGAGKWTPPGGWLEQNETLGECAIREVREEVGVDVRLEEIFEWTEQVHPDGLHDVTFHTIVSMRDPNQEPRIMEPDKATELCWVHPDDLRGRDDLFTPVEVLFAHGRLEVLKTKLQGVQSRNFLNRVWK